MSDYTRKAVAKRRRDQELDDNGLHRVEDERDMLLKALMEVSHAFRDGSSLLERQAALVYVDQVLARFEGRR